VRLLRPPGGGGSGGGGRARRAAPSAGGMWKLVGNAVRRGSPTPLNVGLGPFRRFDWTRLPFDEVRAVGRRAGGTVNDVVLAVATGAVRNLLLRRGTDVEHLDFRAVVPVSVRGSTERSALGNRVSELIATLPIAEQDPHRRLEAVVELTRDLKSSGESGAGELLAQGFDLVPSRLLGPLFRLASRASVANMIITNVPGPRVPVYLLGARQLATYPVVPLMEHQTLGIALMSYEDGLFWGFNADWDAVPELHGVVEDVESGFAQLAGSASGTT
jgi:diacylglycerol O-acyltransferase